MWLARRPELQPDLARRRSSGRDPDPRGELLHTLTEVRSALPPAADMTVEDSTSAEPQRDRCTTSDVTGYDPATVEVGFAAFWPASRVVAWADKALRARGWRALRVSSESVRWQKPVAGETATALLLSGRRARQRRSRGHWSRPRRPWSIRSRASPAATPVAGRRTVAPSRRARRRARRPPHGRSPAPARVRPRRCGPGRPAARTARTARAPIRAR